MALVRILAVVVMVLLIPSAGRAMTGPEAFILSLADRALALVTDNGQSMAEKRARFDELLGDTFDMEGIGRFLLGRYWRTTPPEVQQEYLKAFTENIVYTYTARFDEYSGQKLKIDGSREDGSFTIVNSRIVDPKGSPDVRVEWRLIRMGDSFRVADVVIEGVSMSVTQRQEYASLIQSNGGDVKALIKALNTQMTRLKASDS